MADGEIAGKTSKTADLPVRIVSAVVMLAVAIGALFAGDPWLDLFIATVAAVTLGEFVRLVLKAAQGMAARVIGILFGGAYIGLAAFILTGLAVPMFVGLIGAVIAIDIFAYAFGRTLGGPKIAPAISPSKTWAGLLGGAIGASVWLATFIYVVAWQTSGDMTLGFEVAEIGTIVGLGALLAVAAQTGDFFESWLKRRAGVKDSSNLIPGHGGFFDRTDGMIAAALLTGFFFSVIR